MTDTARETIVITDDTTVDELVEYLTNLNNHAKRQPHIVGDDVIPSAWDKAHRRMDGPLDDLLAARARG